MNGLSTVKAIQEKKLQENQGLKYNLYKKKIKKTI